MSEVLHRADWRYFIPAGSALLAYLLARSMRWRLLLGPTVGLADAFAVTNIGYLVSNVLPLRLGDPARAVAIGLGQGVEITTALSTVIVERVLDMLIVVVLLAATIPFVGRAGWVLEAGLLGGGAALTASIVLLVLARRPGWGRRTVRWSLMRVPRVDPAGWLRALDGLLEGLAALRSLERVGLLLMWSIVTWMCTIGHYFAVLSAFLGRPTVVEASFLTSVTGLGLALPSSPGGMGVYHSLARYALQVPFGVPMEEAMVVAFAAHAFQYVAMCLLGLIGLMQRNLSLGQLRADATATLAKE